MLRHLGSPEEAALESGQPQKSQPKVSPAKTDTCTGLFTFASAVQSVKFTEIGEHQCSPTDIFQAIQNKGHKEALKCGLGAQDHVLYTG